MPVVVICFNDMFFFSANERSEGEGKGKEEEGKGELEVKLWHVFFFFPSGGGRDPTECDDGGAAFCSHL